MVTKNKLSIDIIIALMIYIICIVVFSIDVIWKPDALVWEMSAIISKVLLGLLWLALLVDIIKNVVIRKITYFLFMLFVPFVTIPLYLLSRHRLTDRAQWLYWSSYSG